VSIGWHVKSTGRANRVAPVAAPTNERARRAAGSALAAVTNAGRTHGAGRATRIGDET